MVDILDTVVADSAMTASWRSIGSARFAPFDFDRLVPDPQYALDWGGKRIFWVCERLASAFVGAIAKHAGRIRVKSARDNAGVTESSDTHIDHR